MTDLTQAQRLVLLSAYEHKLGIATRPAKLKGASAAKMMSALVERGFAKEMRAKGEAPVWRNDEGCRYALKILKAGRDAVADHLAEKTKNEAHVSPSVTERTMASITGPKASLIVGLMRRKDGASLQAMIKATGWLPHTTPAALSGLRKKGIVIERSAAEQGAGSIYRILDTAPSA